MWKSKTKKKNEALGTQGAKQDLRRENAELQDWHGETGKDTDLSTQGREDKEDTDETKGQSQKAGRNTDTESGK